MDKLQAIFAKHRDVVLRIEQDEINFHKPKLTAELQGRMLTCEDIEKIIEGLRGLKHYQWELTIKWEG